MLGESRFVDSPISPGVFFEAAAKLIEPARIHRSLILRKMRRCASDLAFTAGND
jgi:hypothetical protein